MYDDDGNDDYAYDAYDYYMHTGELAEEFEDVPIDDFSDDDYNELNEFLNDDANALGLPDESDSGILSTKEMMQLGMLHQHQEKEAADKNRTVHKKRVKVQDSTSVGRFILFVILITLFLIFVLT